MSIFKMKNYAQLIGKDKIEINKIFGFCYNYYHDTQWTFELERKFYLKKELHVYFDEDNIVKKVKIKNKYRLNITILY